MKSRKSIDLSERFHKRWLGYAAAAGAAGVGMVTAAQSAKADIIYTPTNVSLVPNSSVTVDNFTFTDHFYSFRGPGSAYSAGGLKVQGLGANFFALSQKGYAANLSGGARIGSSMAFANGARVMASFVYSRFSNSHSHFYRRLFFGPWYGRGGGGYLGLEFDTAEGTDFGWMKVNVSGGFTSPFEANISGYAYDTVPGQAILAGQTTSPTPEPGTLGLLAIGHFLAGKECR